MATTTILDAKPRDVIGKANRRLSAEGLVPAVIYGHGREATPISVDRHDFEMLLAHGGASTVFQVKIEGEKEPVDVVIKEVQSAAVKGTVLHADFYVVKMDEVLQVSVPLRYEGEDVAVGVKEGGVLMHNLREISVEALPRDLPESITVDISALEMNSSIHVEDLVAPEGVSILDDPQSIVCSIAPPRIEVEEVEEVEEELEPELIGERAEEAEEAEGA